jgi:DNA (cytosine-5)-methyltransferase 1
MGKGINTTCDEGQTPVVTFDWQKGNDRTNSRPSTMNVAVDQSQTIGSTRVPAVAFTKSKRAQSTTDDESWVPGEVSPTMSCFDQGDTRATTVVTTPIDLRQASRGEKVTNNRAVGSGGPPGHGVGEGGDPAFTVSERGQAVAFTQNCRDEVRQINGDGQIAGALSADSGSDQTNYVAYDILGTPATNAAKPTDVHVPLRSRLPGQSEASTTTVVAVDLQNVQVGGDLAGTLDTTRPSRGGGQAVAFANRTRDGIKVPEVMKDGIVPALTNPGGGGRSDAVNVAYSTKLHNTTSNGAGKCYEEYTAGIDANSPAPALLHPMAVRRLTPRECERLQGFPDDYTLVEYRKKPAADGPRYRALGNSMAVPVMRWIGERIAMVDRIKCP